MSSRELERLAVRVSNVRVWQAGTCFRGARDDGAWHGEAQTGHSGGTRPEDLPQ